MRIAKRNLALVVCLILLITGCSQATDILVDSALPDCPNYKTYIEVSLPKDSDYTFGVVYFKYNFPAEFGHLNVYRYGLPVHNRYYAVHRHYVVPAEFEYLSEFEMRVAFVEGMADLNLQQKINDTLQYSMLSWINEPIAPPPRSERSGIEFPYVNNVVLHKLSNRYISISSSFDFYTYHHREDADNNLYVAGHLGMTLYDFVTIDMQTGERVFLNDLIDVNDDFIHKLQTGQIARVTNIELAFDDESAWNWLSWSTFERLQELLDECSMTQQEINVLCSRDGESLWGFASNIPTDISALIWRGNFYIAPGELRLWFGGLSQTGLGLTIDLDDIRDFLKVEAW